MSSGQPRKIFRYQQFSAMTIESLCHDQLHFADPAAFNDPLDCRPTVESDSDRDTLLLILTELVRRRVEAEALASLKNVKLKGEQVAAHARKMGEQAARSELEYIAYHATNPEYGKNEAEAECRLLISVIERELKKQYDRGVCCFSASVKKPLLWSHYGDQHRGLCVGYGLSRIPKPRLQKVVYGGSRKIMTSLIAQALLENDPEALVLLDRDVLFRKASSWRYEREWRLLGNRGVQGSTLALKDVTFGLRCPVALKHAVITALKSRQEKVEFYEMYEVRGSFRLRQGRVEANEMLALLPHTARSGEELFGPFNED